MAILKRITDSFVRLLGRVSLRWLLVAFFVLKVLLVGGTIGWFAWESSQASVANLFSQLQQETLDRITQQLDTYLQIPIRLNQINQEVSHLVAPDLRALKKLERLFWQEIQTHPVSAIQAANEVGELMGVRRLSQDYVHLLYSDPDQTDQVQIYATDVRGHPTDLIQTLPSWNATYQAWYTEAARAGKLTWTSVSHHAEAPNVPVISCSLPIYNHTTLLGVLSVELKLSDVSDFLKTVKTTASGQIFILDRYGLLMASSSEAPAMKMTGQVVSRLRAEDSADRLIQFTTRSLYDRVPHWLDISHNQTLVFREGQQRRFVQVTPWQDSLGLDWLIVNVVPESDVMGEIVANRQKTLWLCLLALGVAIILGLLSARWIVYPIVRLSRSAEALSQGIFETPVDTWRQDEVGKLARSFQRMAHQLHASLMNLEEQVADRTSELTASEEINRSLLRAIPDLMVRINREGTYLDYQPSEYFPSATTHEEVIGFNIYDLLPPDLAEQHMQGVWQALATHKLQFREYRLLLKGQTYYEESRIVPINEHEVLLMVRDISDRKHREEETRLLLSVTQLISAASSFQDALTVAIHKICESTGWIYGEAWMPTADGQALECSPSWYLNTDLLQEEQILAFDDFRNYSEGLVLLPEQGLPGRVWQQQQPIWVADVESDWEVLSLREDPAEACAFKSGVGFPILNQQGKMLVVLVFWMVSAHQQGEATMELVSAVTAQLGVAIQQKQTEAMLAGLFSAMDDVILVFDDQGVCLEVITSHPDLLMADPGEQVGKALSELLLKSQAHQFHEYIWEVLRTQRTIAVEYSLLLRGQEVWFSAKISPLSQTTVIWVARDITRKKQAEAVLRQREAELAQTSRFLDSIIETMPLAVFAKDVKNNFCYVLWNRAAEEIYAIPRDRVLGRTTHDLVGRELADKIAAEHQLLVEQRQLVITDELFRSKFHGDIWQRVRKLPIVDEQGEVTHLLYIAEDVTEHKRLEAELKAKNEVLRQAEEKYRSIVENAVDGIFQSTPEGYYVSANLALAKIYGYDSPEELIAAHVQIAKHVYVKPSDRDRFIAAISSTGSVSNFEVQVYRKDRSKIWVAENVREVRDNQGNLLYYEGIVTDITRRRMAELSLRLEKDKSERLLANILPASIISRLKQDNSAIAESFEEVSILFADIVGFTPMSARMQPIELVSLLNEIFCEFDKLVDRYDLEKIKTIGDAYMVASGLPIPRHDHAEAIADLALAMQTTIKTFSGQVNLPLELRIGINSGVVVAGVIGIKKFIYDLWGDTVNVASRMESQGEPGKIQIAQATYDRLKNQYDFIERGQIAVKGKGNMSTYWLQARLNP